MTIMATVPWQKGKTMTEYIVNPEEEHNLFYGRKYEELIRCKDCKYYFKSDEKCQLIDTRLHFYEANKRWTEDSFCSWAERKPYFPKGFFSKERPLAKGEEDETD